MLLMNRTISVPATGREPLATIVVTPRERFSVAQRSLDSIIANTATSYRLVCVAGGAPPEVQQYLTETCAAHGFDLILRPQFLGPNAARNIGLAKANTKYVVFLENDVIVEPDWMDRLLDCAETEGADIVSPLCLQGEIIENILHTMGGVLQAVPRDGKIVLNEIHHTERNGSENNPERLKRIPIDYAEFHCALVRRSVFDRLGPLDERIVGAAEHIDLALHLRKLGCRGVAEPNAVVSYLPSSYTIGDLDTYTVRWCKAWHFPTMAHLAGKWAMSEESPLLRDYQSSFFELRERCLLGQEERIGAAQKFPTQVLRGQTIVQLLDQMETLDYNLTARETVRGAYMIAAELFAASFRASGRTFLAHLVGTGSIMAAFGANPAVIAAAVLHATYTHGRFPKKCGGSPAAMRRWLKRRVGDRVEALVLAYSGLHPDQMVQYFPDHLDRMPLETANAILVRMANGIEDRLGRDEHYFDSAHWLHDSNESLNRWMPVFTAVADKLGFSAMTSVLRDAVANSGVVVGTAPWQQARPSNFIIEADTGAIEPLPERSLSGFFAPPAFDLPVETMAALPPLAIDLGLLKSLNGGSIAHARDGVRLIADPRPWAYSAYLRLQDVCSLSGRKLTGQGQIEIRLQAMRGRIGVLVLEVGSSVYEIAPEQHTTSGAGIVTLCFQIPAFEEVGDVVFRNWPSGDGEAHAVILEISVRNKL